MNEYEDKSTSKLLCNGKYIYNTQKWATIIKRLNEASGFNEYRYDRGVYKMMEDGHAYLLFYNGTDKDGFIQVLNEGNDDFED